MQKKLTNKTSDELIAGFLKRELDAEETKELLNWVKESAENKRIFDEYSEVWITSMASLKNPGYNYHEGFYRFKQRISPARIAEIQNPKALILKSILKYAAIIAIAVSASGLLFYNLGRSEELKNNFGYSELFVPMGSKAEYLLSDGTTVTLNAGSRLRYDSNYGNKERVVQLDGEGFFKVAKDSKRPFIVKTSHINVMALGTAFNVKAYAADTTIETTLVEGSVKIEEASENNSSEQVVLKPNQKMTFFKSNSELKEENLVTAGKNTVNKITVQSPEPVEIPKAITENINVEPVISWKENKWIFEKQSLEQIAVDLERKFDVHIEFKSERLKNYRFTGTIIEEPIEQVLEVMSISAPINFSVKGRIVTLSENKNFNAMNRSLYDQK